MDQSWKTHIIILMAINFPELILSSPLDDNVDQLGYPMDYMYPADDTLNEQLQKRLSSFVRIGRGLSSFIRIGKNGPGFTEFEADSDDGDDEREYQKRKSAFVRIGRGDEEPEAQKRLSSFVRIGKSGGDEEDTDPYFTTANKRGGAFIRLGKFPSSAFVRNRSGKIHSIASPPYYRRSGRIGHSSFIRIGKRDTRDALKQALDDKAERIRDFMSYQQGVTDEDAAQGLEGPMPDLKSAEEKRMSSFVRIGRPDGADDGNNNPFGPWPAGGAKRFSKFVRIGKDDQGDDMYKRMSSFVRIGKNYESPSDIEKRLSSFVRIGKNSIDAFSNGDDKRFSKFVRIGKASELSNEEFNPDKRFSKFVRIGKGLGVSDEGFNVNPADKRFSKFVRIGKDIDAFRDNSDQAEEQQLADKRMSSFVRIGKSDADKRMSSFVRIGKSDAEKRLSSFVRIGKKSSANNNIVEAIQTDSDTADLTLKDDLDSNTSD